MQNYVSELKAFAASKEDNRPFRLAAMGVRNDGTIVRSINGSPRHFMKISVQAHAEARLSKKLDVGAIVMVVRILKNGNLAMAKPCKNCQRILKSRGVAKVIYSNDFGDFETMTLD